MADKKQKTFTDWQNENESKVVLGSMNVEQGKGIIHQIEDKEAPYGSVEGELTEEKLMSFLQDIMASPDAPKPMVMLTGCIEKGIVTQSSVEFNLCNNPDCKTCRNLEDALKEQCK